MLTVASVILGLAVIATGDPVAIFIGLILVIGLPILFTKASSASPKPKKKQKSEPSGTTWLWALGISFMILSFILFQDTASQENANFGDGDWYVRGIITGMVGLAFLIQACIKSLKR